MIQTDQSRYESIIIELVNTKDVNSLVSLYSRDKVYYCSILNDIGNKNSINSKIVKKSAKNLKLSESYIREQAISILSYLYPKPSGEDYYKILNISPDSTKDEIRKSWTRLMKENHPDLKGPEGLDISRRINEAYSVLRDDKKKEEYDSKRLPLLKVGLVHSPSRSASILSKFALCSLVLVVLMTLYFVFSNKEDRTELANFQSSDLDFHENDEENLKIDENAKVLEQIARIEPKKIKFEKPKTNLDIENTQGSSFTTQKVEENKTEQKQIFIKEKTDNIEVIDQPVKRNIIVNQPVIKEKVVVKNNPVTISDVKPGSQRNEKVSKEKIKSVVTNPTKKIANEEKYIVSKKIVSNKVENPAEITEKIVKEPNSSSLFSFVSDYVSAYKDRDISRIESLFLSDAVENGMPISKAIGSYQKNFNDNNILQYDVKVNETKINDSKGFIDSDFNIVFKKLSNDEVKTSSGSITWNLIWDESNWKIKDINYNIDNTKRMDKSL